MDHLLMVLGFNLPITRAGVATHLPSDTYLLVLHRCMRSTMVKIFLALLLFVSLTTFSVALGDLSTQTIAMNATHHGGRTELDMHNLFGHLLARTANLAVRELHPGKRPFLISRSTFAGSGRWTGHWVSRIFLDGRARPILIRFSAISWETTGASGRTCTTASRAYYNSNFSKSRW